jgi:transcription elongation factor Elf1
MLDLDNHELDFRCPRCGFYNRVTLKAVRLRDAVICRGCKATIRFEDYMNETRKAVRAINRALRELEDQISSIGTVTIQL